MPLIPMPDRVVIADMPLEPDPHWWRQWTTQPGDHTRSHTEVLGPGAPVNLAEMSPQTALLLERAVAINLPAADTNALIRLRDYQQECVAAVADAWWKRGVQRPLVVLPTGAGKTIVAAELIRIFHQQSLGERVLFLAHRKVLLDQTAEKLRLVSPATRVGVVQAKHNELGREVTVASIQTLGHRSRNRLQQLMEHGPYGLIILDEAHHSTSEQHETVLRALAEANPQRLLLGLTATPGRADGTALDTVFDEVAFERNLFDMINLGWLVPPRGFRVHLDVDLDRVESENGDFVASQLSKVMNTPQVNTAVVHAWMRYGMDRKFLVFTVDVAHARDLSQEFRDAGYNAAVLTGGTKEKERETIYKQFRSGEVKLLISCQVLTEGYDEPSAEGVLFARPTQSQGLFIQCLDEQTEILTHSGWRTRETIEADDLVGTLDPATQMFKWSPILSRTDRPLHPDEHMHALSLPALNIRVTGQHRMMYVGSKPRQVRWTVAAHMPDSCKIPVAAESPQPDNPNITDDELRILGWWYAEGSYYAPTNGLTINQSVKHPVYVEEIAELLRRCKFRFGEHTARYKTEYAEENVMVRFTLSYGAPRRIKDRHLTGWKRLALWINQTGSKRPTAAFWTLSGRQLLLFLETFNKGDGAAQQSPSVDYTPRSWRITQRPRDGVLDELQALCVTHGIRCNLYMDHYHGEYNRMSVTPGKTWHTVNGSNRRELGFHRTVRFANERVWCVETTTGTIITRRLGTVAIVGNCMGRGLRLYPGKSECIVIDCVGNTEKHQPVQLATLAGFEPELPLEGDGEPELDEEAGDGDSDPTVLSADIRGEEFSFHARQARTRYQWRETGVGWILQVPRIGYYLVAWSDRARQRATIRFYDQRKGRRDTVPREVCTQPIAFEIAYSMVEAEMDRIFNARSNRRNDQTDDVEDAPDISFVDFDDGLEEPTEIPEEWVLRGAEWRDARISERQRSLLTKLGAKRTTMPETAGEASDLIVILQVEWDVTWREPATQKQLAYIHVNGLDYKPGMTKKAAARQIWKHRKASGR